VVTTQNAAGTNRSVINWQSFSVPTGSTTRFDQPTAQSLSINRVVGNNPSAIFGTLSSNGRLVLVNPSGIAVGAGAVVDTAADTAVNLGTLKGDAVGIFAGTLKHSGLIQAQTATLEGGRVVLKALANAEVTAGARIQADGGAGAAGGQVTIPSTAGDVTVAAG